MGWKGLAALRDTTAYIRKTAPDAVLLADVKRGDIDSTSVKYAEAMFDYWGFDAVTVNGYMGGESLSPFFNYADKGVFVVCRSSNPGAAEFQDIIVSPDALEVGMDGSGQKMPLYEWMAVRSSKWNANGNSGAGGRRNLPGAASHRQGALSRSAHPHTRCWSAGGRIRGFC